MELNHVGTRTLKTTRLLLRPFCLSDAQAMFDNWANDAEVTKFMMWEPHASVEVTQSILESWMPLYEKPLYACVGIIGLILGDVLMVLIDPRINFGKKEGGR